MNTDKKEKWVKKSSTALLIKKSGGTILRQYCSLRTKTFRTILPVGLYYRLGDHLLDEAGDIVPGDEDHEGDDEEQAYLLDTFLDFYVHTCAGVSYR